MALSFRQTASISPISPFWNSAKETLRLGALRTQVKPIRPLPVDPILARPEFLPLCGNGRIDTKADYEAFYLAERRPPLSMTMQQMGVIMSPPTLETPFDPSTLFKLFNLTIFVDEECDDGNRIDFDGCSADCMNMDLWSTPCEIATDKHLVYEDIMYDPIRQVMIASALDGIYALHTIIGNTSVSAILLAPKSFPVVNMFRHNSSIILYSSEQQQLWQLVDGEAELSPLNNLQLGKWNETNPVWKCHANPDGSIIARDSTAALYLPTPTAPFQESVYCDTGRDLGNCIFVGNQDNTMEMHCGNTFIAIGPNNTCQFGDKGLTYDGSDRSNLWKDVFNDLMPTGTFNTIRKYKYVVSPPLASGNTVFNPVSMEVYNAMGGIMEGTVADPRHMLTTNSVGEPVQFMPYYIGDPSLLEFATDTFPICGNSPCVFDNDVGYDMFETPPTKHATGVTWNDKLQSFLDDDAKKEPLISAITAVRTDPLRYSRLINTFVKDFVTTTRPLVATSILKHPRTKSTWITRKDKLIEISKSGVILRRDDRKCLPSDVALCSTCHWAPSGRPCRPCSEKDPTSLAWNAKCKSCPLPAARRRLLAEGKEVIEFTLKGNFSKAKAEWPEAVEDNVTSLISIKVHTSDAPNEMKHIKQRLIEMQGDVQVVEQPCVPIPVRSAGLDAVSSTLLPVVTTTPLPESTPLSPVNEGDQSPVETFPATTTIKVSDTTTAKAVDITTTKASTTSNIVNEAQSSTETLSHPTTTTTGQNNNNTRDLSGSLTPAPKASNDDNIGIVIVVGLVAFCAVVALIAFFTHSSSTPARMGAIFYQQHPRYYLVPFPPP